jgi:hypothetical protein
MATPTYGTTSPAAIDPFPIESVLAKIVGDANPDNAANMLNTYQMKNLTSQGNYNYDMQQQHEFAKQQLAQQLQESYMKYGQEALKTPGGISLLRSQGGQGALGADFGPDQINTIETNLGNAQQAGTAEKVASAAYHGVQAGYPPNLPDLTRLSSGLFNTQGTPLQLQVEGMKQAGANARHAAGAGDKTKFNIMVDGGVDENGNPIKMNVPIRMSDTNEQIRAKGQAAINARNIIYPPGTGVGGATPPGGSPPPPVAPPRALPQPRGATNLPPASSPTPGSAPGGAPQAASSTFIRDPRAQNAAKVAAQHLSPQARLDVGANVQGTVMPIVPLAGGGVGFVGKSGTIHTLPPPGSN